MKFKIRWLPFVSVVVMALLCGLFGLALGQGPVLTFLPTPTPAPFTPSNGFSSGPISAAAPPDLIVTNVETHPATPKVGQPTIISVTIKNNSSVNLNNGNNFLIDLYVDPPFAPVPNYHQIENPTLGLPWGAQWFWVPAGGSYVLTTTWVFTDVKTFEVWAQVDSGGDVVEANEDNNTKKVNVTVLTGQSFKHDTHQDFMTNMASTLDNSDPSGKLRLGRFIEPPRFHRPFTNGAPSCQITSNMVVSDYNMANPDTRLNIVTTGRQIEPQLITNGSLFIAVWQDGRNGDLTDSDIYLRYSMDSGLTWGPEQRVNDDPGVAHQLNPVAALSDDGNLLVAWQDRRNGDYDIYAQRYVLTGGTLTTSGNNIRGGKPDSFSTKDQINPDIAIDEAGGFYVTWQDNRDNNYNIYATGYISVTGSYTWTNLRQVNDDPQLTQQSNPTINVVDWLRVTDIEYTIGPAPDYQVTVDRVISEPIRTVAVVWEDYRLGNADIAIAISTDSGETFGFDAFINNDANPQAPPNPLGPHQLDPDVALTKNKTVATISVPLPNGSEANVEVEIPVTGIHTVWQDYRNGTSANPDPDIYYSLSELGVEQVDNIFNLKLAVGSNEKINQKDVLSWQTQPVVQRDPAIVAVPCGGDAPPEQSNKFIFWADGRNYDDANYDVYYTLKSDCGATLGDNQMLNDGVHLYNFDTSNPSYADYDPGHPPPARQVNPSVTTDIQLQGSTVYGGYIYVAWEDDRAGNPQQQKDLYFARSNLTFFNQDPYGFNDGAGSQISNILDSGSTNTTWYTVDWSAATDNSTYVTVQTRLGNTISEVLSSAWYPQRFPFQPQPGACNNPFNDTLDSGAPLPGYNAPGQHIEDAFGNVGPKARYIQYRVNFYTRESTNTPELYNLTLYYDTGGNFVPGGPSKQIYLPIVLK